MKKTILILSLGGLLLAGCGRRTPRQVEAAAENAARQAVATATAAVAPPENSGYTPIALTGGKGTATVAKAAGEHVVLAFESGDYRHLHAELKAPNGANVRFTQLFAPDGAADGPFGREIDRELTQSGLYKLSVGENTMAGDPWAGEVTVTIDLR